MSYECYQCHVMS